MIPLASWLGKQGSLELVGGLDSWVLLFTHSPTHSSRSGLSCREYILYSSDELKSSLPFSTSALDADSMGCGRPMDSRKETATIVGA